MIRVDNRWVGNFGISRFAGEVIPRLPDEFLKIGSGSPWNLIGTPLSRGSKRDINYVPAFNPTLSLARQVLTVMDLIHLDVPGESSFLRRRYYDFFVRPTIRRTGIVHTISETSSERLREWLDDDSVAIENVGISVSSAFNRSVPSRRSPDPSFVFVGNMKPHKNPQVVWRALKLRPAYRLVVVTNDTEDASRLAHEYGVEQQVILKTGVSDTELATIYTSAWGLMFPSLFEGFGLPALEAVSVGLPVAFAESCDVVGRTVGSRGIPVGSNDDPEAWALAMDSLAVTDWRRAFASESRIDSWTDVAGRVRRSLLNLA